MLGRVLEGSRGAAGPGRGAESVCGGDADVGVSVVSEEAVVCLPYCLLGFARGGDGLEDFA